ncbi:unnamed protein product [Mycena citricolor]|nr:unnamed protein product [Mycena citricolor]
MGREVLAKWGYRRCEDVVWVKTNKTTNNGPGTDPPTTSLLTRTKQHCLIGIRGTVRRSTDSWFVHCNVDTDVIFWEGDDADPTRKPPEMYSLIENFCLGTRRLELFGRAPTSLRRGWVTALASGQESRLGLDPDGTGTVYSEEGAVARPWNLESWDADIKVLAAGGRMVVPTTSEIDALRPKSPVRPGSLQAQANHVPGANVGPRFAAVNRAGFVPNPMGQMPQMMMGIPMNGMGMLGGAEGMMHGQWPGMMAMPGAGMGLNAGGMGINNGVMALNGAGMGSNGMLGQMGMGMAYNPAFNGAGWADQQYGMEGAWGDGSWGTNGQGQGGY